MSDSAPDRSHIAPVTSREELIYLLSRASELEHGLACIYLFAAFSLKSDIAEGGLNAAQAEMVRGWKRRLSAVGVEEMLHLAQVSNMLTAIGGAPHFKRTNMPMPASAFPFGLRLSLEPFSQETIDRFVCYEMPEAGILTPAQEAIYAEMRAQIVESEQAPGYALHGTGGAPINLGSESRAAVSEPFEIDFTTVGEFYHKIETGFLHIPEGELFIGPREAQANAGYLDLAGELVAVVDQASACSAIDMIVEQGEAPSSAHPDAHFSVFDRIRLEYMRELETARARGAPFDPVRPTVSNPMTRFYDDTSGGTIITDPTTHDVAELFNISYDTMLLMLLRFFAHTDEPEAELAHLSRATLRLMTTVLRPLGEALAKMPVGFDGKTAGPGFGYNRDVHLLPHKASAWVFFAERLRDLALTAARLREASGVPVEVDEAAAALEDLATQFAPTDRTWSAATEVGEFSRIDTGAARAIRPETNGPYLVTNVERLVNSRGDALPARPRMALCRCGGSNNKPFCDGTHARIGFTSAKSTNRVADHRDAYTRGELTVFDNRGICQHSGFCTDALPTVFRTNSEPFVDLGSANNVDEKTIIEAVRRCPSGALSYAVDGIEHRDQDREPTITVSRDGPYRITGAIQLPGEARAEGASAEHYALCRCGGSRNKPFCDGTHWYIKFHDEKN